MKNSCIALSDAEVSDIENHAYNTAIKIVTQVAEEHGDGWTPCSKNLPKENGWYECWCIIYAIGEKKGYRPKTLYWEDNLWLYNPYGFSMPDKESVVAWKPIIPYKMNGE